MSPRLALFQGIGVELEYMIVDRETLAVRPIADKLIEAEAGEVASEIERGDMAWSNELVLHVLELKTNGPAVGLAGLAARFQGEVVRANELLAPMGARLLAGGMHPWMDPHAETRLWPHEYNDVYRAFDRIFGCSGHGWSNLQSTHLNFPFADDEEFGRLHDAIRLVLPLVPALAASSPARDGRVDGTMDHRLAAYRGNARRVPSVSGRVIPERMRTREEYQTKLLGRLYADIAPLDPEGVLRHEWLNARGAIARFDRGAIEIRLIDAQECPLADLSVAAAVHAAVRELTEGALASAAGEADFETDRLADLLDRTIRDADEALVDDPEYLDVLGCPRSARTAGDVWRHLVELTVARTPGGDEWMPTLELVMAEGCLARRLARALGGEPGPRRMREVYGRLADCLERGEPFRHGG